jgi:uncharacterized protein
MSREFPDFVDPWRAADGGRRIGGTIPLARFKRLLPMLVSDKGEASFELIFGYDAQHRPTVAVEVEARLNLLCQRSLEPYFEQVRQQSELQIIGEAEEQALLSDEEEFLLVQDGHVAVADLVEDELLLAVPQIPRNPASEPIWASTATDGTSGKQDAAGEHRPPADGTDDGKGGRTQRPFESLAEMLKNK